MMLNKLAAKYELHDSLDEMLDPKNLSELLNRQVSQVSYKPFDSADSHSGNPLYYVMVDEQRLVMKQLRPKFDWKSIATEDHRCRSVRVWQYGILDQLRPDMDHAVLAACHFGEDYGLLMRDVSEGLNVTEDMYDLLMESLASIHAKYWEDDSLQDPALGFSSVSNLVSVNWSKHWDSFSHDPVTVTRLKEGWDVLLDELDPDASSALESIQDNPQPLFDALAKLPHTLIHAGYRVGNMAVFPTNKQVVSYDWQEVSYAPSSLCLAWFILNEKTFPKHEIIIQHYLDQLSFKLGYRLDTDLWQKMFDLGCLAVILRKANWHAWYFNKSDGDEKASLKQLLNDYNTLIRKGTKWL